MQLKHSRSILIVLVAVVVFAGGGLLFYFKFEGERPSLSLTPEPKALGLKATFDLAALDRRSGLKSIRVEILQEDRAVAIFKEDYPPKSREVRKILTISPRDLELKDGEALLRVEARDHSWRRGGNPKVLESFVTIDTRPPNIAVVSRFHYVNQGGACLVAYRATEELSKNGVEVGDLWFQGFPLGDDGYIVLFAVPYDMPPETSIVLVAEDLAGNLARTDFYHKIRPKSFRRDIIRVTDRFLKHVTPYFVDRDPSLKGDPMEVFLRINRNFRATDDDKIKALCQKTHPEPLWSGPFLRLANTRTMAGFADHRVYMHDGKEIDRQVHLGVDLASVPMSPVTAANRGSVVFAGELGIYGNTILIDHGCGLFSMYSHLSRVDVRAGQTLEKGDPMGLTGSTGLAGGDHLHFSMLVHGIFVNPVEWWDPHWVGDNVDSKLAMLRTRGG